LLTEGDDGGQVERSPSKVFARRLQDYIEERPGGTAVTAIAEPVGGE